MSRRVLRTGLLVVLFLPCFGQVSGTVAVADSQTYGMWNGRLWNQLPKDGKTIYLNGFLDAVKWKVQEKALPGWSEEKYQKEEHEEWAARFSVGEYVQVLDELYKQPENILIPIPMAVKFYCTPKLTGTSNVGDLENLLIKIRQATQPSATPR
jgi:hypothetical protein